MYPAYHHETAGQAERINRVLEETLRHVVSDKMDDWDDLLPAAEFSLSITASRSPLALFFSPFFLKYSYHPSVLLDIGVRSHPAVTECLSQQQGLMQTADRYPFAQYAQQRLDADRIAACIVCQTLACMYSNPLIRGSCHKEHVPWAIYCVVLDKDHVQYIRCHIDRIFPTSAAVPCLTEQVSLYASYQVYQATAAL